jgi:hypothetical protein
MVDVASHIPTGGRVDHTAIVQRKHVAAEASLGVVILAPKGVQPERQTERQTERESKRVRETERHTARQEHRNSDVGSNTKRENRVARVEKQARDKCSTVAWNHRAARARTYQPPASAK